MNITAMFAFSFLSEFDLQKRVAPILCLLIATLLLVTLLLTLSKWKSDWLLVYHNQGSAHKMTFSSENASKIKSIPNDHLFGMAFSPDSEAPITRLGLRVTGIVKQMQVSQDRLSKAYISIGDQPSKIYQVGDSLPYGVKIYEITRDTVLLENDGHLEKLPLLRSQLTFKPRRVLN